MIGNPSTRPIEDDRELGGHRSTESSPGCAAADRLFH
jgi:hypothetical protein